MLYIDDKLTRHPKIYKAGSQLGDNGAALALSVYLDGLSYAREHLTDGFIPEKYLASSGLVSKPYLVARALASRSVRLWHRVPGGYQIHDYHDWNRNASEVKQKREAERVKKARQREAQRKGNGELSTACPAGCPEGTSRARASTNHDPRTTGQIVLVPPVVDRKIKITAADAAARVQISTEFARLCVLAHYAAEGLGDGAEPGAIADEVKWAIAAAQFDSPNPEDLTAAVHAVMTARAKGYRTPRQRRRVAS